MKAAIIGYGKMGREIERILTERGHEAALIIDTDNAHELDAAHLAGIDVALEFTTPETAYRNIRTCIECGVAAVSGTTGWTARLGELQELCRERGGAACYAANYCLGLNLMLRLNRQLAAMIDRVGGYDVRIEEVHHTQKKDAPSGTAKLLVEALDPAGELTPVYGREGLCGERRPDEIGIHALRGGTVAGTHSVHFFGPDEELEFTHRATSRRSFVRGALKAARALVREPKGFHSLDDLLFNTNGTH